MHWLLSLGSRGGFPIQCPTAIREDDIKPATKADGVCNRGPRPTNIEAGPLPLATGRECNTQKKTIGCYAMANGYQL